MSRLATIRAAIASTLAAVPQIGVVHDRERYTRDETKFRELYVYELDDGSSGANTVSINHFVPGGESLATFILGSTFVQQTAFASITVDGLPVWAGAGVAGSTVTGGIQVSLAPGWHTLGMSSFATAGTAGTSIYALSTRR